MILICFSSFVDYKEQNLRFYSWNIACQQYWLREQICLELKVWISSFLNIRSSCTKYSSPEVFLGKGFLKIYSKFTGELPCRSVISINMYVTLLKSHFSMGFLLQICCIFSEHIFLKTLLEDWICSTEMSCKKSIFKNFAKFVEKYSCCSL